MPILHMETDTVRGVAQQLKANAVTIQAEHQNLNRSVQNLTLVWQGGSADQFSQQTQALLTQIQQVLQQGEELGNRLECEVAEWEQVAASLNGAGNGVPGSAGLAGAISGAISAGAVGSGSSTSGESSSPPASETAPPAEPPQAPVTPAPPPPPAAPPSGPGVGSNLRPWIPVNPTTTNEVGNRNANAYNAVLNQFNVGENARYAQNQQGKGETYCNIFTWDVTRAMGVEIPHWVDVNGNGVPVGSRVGRELSANGQIRWLEQHGPSRGWRTVSAAEAQSMANGGHPTIASWYNPRGIGHVGMVRPGENLALAQAGARNFNDGTIADGFGNRSVVYYVHD